MGWERVSAGLRMGKPIVAIVGRPNVGKSTLFNRVAEERLAIVADLPGTTRDRLYAGAQFAGREFTIVDTGGIVGERDVAETQHASIEFTPLIRAQAELAIEDADAVIFLVDVTQGVMPGDYEIADILRRSRKPVFVAANKADNAARRAQAVEFYALGLGEPIPVSALSGMATGDLLETVVSGLPSVEEEENELPRIAIVGRPNVGKSSLLNAILGQERAIVSEIPGTTRDAIDTEFKWRGEPTVLIDTAGIRRRGKIIPGLEKASTLRAIRAIQRAEVALVVMDAGEGILTQDQHVAAYALEEGRGIVLVVNKMDLLEGGEALRQEWKDKIAQEFNFISFAPVVFASAKLKKGIPQVMDTALRVRAEWQTRVSTSDLNELVREALAAHPPLRQGRTLKLYYGSQIGTSPPKFVFFVNDPRLVHFSFERFLENRIRERWKLTGTPIRLLFRSHRKKGE